MKRGCFLAVAMAAVMMLGCSAKHWGGNAAGESPGVKVRGPTVFTPAEINVTSNTTASLDQLTYDGGKLSMTNARFGQDAAAVTAVQPDKIRAIADLQRTQVEYVAALGEAIRASLAELAPVLKILAMAQFADVPGGGVVCNLPAGATTPSGVPLTATKLAEWIQQVAAAADVIDRAVNQPPASQPVIP